MARWELWDAAAITKECMSLGVRPKKDKPEKPRKIKKRRGLKSYKTTEEQLNKRRHVVVTKVESEPGHITEVVKVKRKLTNIGLFDNKTPENEAQAKYIQSRKSRVYDNVPDGMFLTSDIAEYLNVPEYKVILVAGTMNLLRRNRGRKDYAPMTAATARLVIQQFRVGKEM